MNTFTVRFITGVVLIVIGCAHASALELIEGEITEYGYYQKQGDFKRYRNISTTTGYVKEGSEVELVEKTDRIPLAMNRLFGFKFRLSGFDGKEAVQLKLVVTHPKIKRPNGSESTGYSYPILLDVKDGIIENRSGYSIDHDFEMVEGEWTFEIWYYKQKLVSQTFTTFGDQNKQANPESDTDTNESGDQQNPTADNG